MVSAVQISLELVTYFNKSYIRRALFTCHWLENQGANAMVRAVIEDCCRINNFENKKQVTMFYILCPSLIN